MRSDTRMTDSEIRDKATALLRRFYGYSSFRPHQLEIITAVMQGHDVTVLMPTGGGKSVCFQIPALLGNGFAIVVSPLLSLMKDQVSALLANGIPAASVNSLQSDEENHRILEQLITGKIKILYISPERLLMEMDRWSSDLPVDLIAIDEAHCISQWGHDFRPDYTRLSRIKELMPDVPIMALTATADRLTRDDIALQLRLQDPKLFVGSFDRPNLSLKVMLNPGKADRYNMICSMINRYRYDSGIVYCMSRKIAENVSAELSQRGFRSAPYHAGLSAELRNDTQEKFINGEYQVICATVAFGMGIDKSNIRWVIHYNLPKNIESYYQEIGRAGRDGSAAETVMFYSYADIATLQSFVDESGQRSVNMEKLERIKAYAEASVCRRRVLLSYFNEILDHDCGNCDVCRNPPQRFDGKIIAQKALSAVVRTGESVGITMLIDILRGMSNAELISKGYHLIKTYGAGRDMSFGQWNHYIAQLIQLGMFEIAYDRHNHLTVTDYGRAVLRGEVEVSLAKYSQIITGKSGKVRRRMKEDVTMTDDERLMILLKALRENIASSEGIPSYLVLNDRILEELVRLKPQSMEEFADVEGIGERRVIKYWRRFVNEILVFLGKKKVASRGVSAAETALLLSRDFQPAEIAEIKGIKVSSVYHHIVELIDADRFTDFSRVITRNQYLHVMKLYEDDPEKLYERIDKDLPYGLPTVALAISRYLLRHKK